MKNQENRVEDNDKKDEKFQPIEDETNVDGNEPLKNKSDSVVHMLPSKIEYDGPAPVNSYFHVTKKLKQHHHSGNRDTKPSLVSHFRGRQLLGTEVILPKTIIGLYTKKEVTVPTQAHHESPSSSSSSSSSSSTSLIVEGSFQSIHVWDHDRLPSVAPLEEIIAWFDLADVVSNLLS